MKKETNTILILLMVFGFSACSISDSENNTDTVDDPQIREWLRLDKDLPLCNIDVDINDKSWDKYHSNERSAIYSSSRVQYRPLTNREVADLNFSCTRYYDSFYSELLRFTFEISPDEDIVEWSDNEDKLVPDRVSFSEYYTDYGISSYSHIDTTQTHYVNIKEIDYGEMMMRAEFEFTLIVSDSFREENSLTYHQRRYPDQIQVSGEITAEFEDIREKQESLFK